MVTPAARRLVQTAARSAIAAGGQAMWSMRVRLREIAAVRRRFGYRRLHILWQRGGLILNHKKLRRI
jgi:hypothetical protein